MNSISPLTGKKIIVVGGAGLLGSQFCTELVEAGASVIVGDINLLELEKLKNANDNLICISLDITDINSISHAFDIVENQVGKLDGVVISSGIDAKVSQSLGNVFCKFEDLSLEQWNLEIMLGLTGVTLFLKKFSELLRQGASVVVVSSDLSVISPDHRLYNLNSTELKFFKPLSYSVIKTGLIGLVRYLAIYWANREIRINALSPGGVENNQPDDFKEALKSRIPLARLADKSEYNKIINFLLSDGSKYLTGQNIVMDGGRSVW